MQAQAERTTADQQRRLTAHLANEVSRLSRHAQEPTVLRFSIPRQLKPNITTRRQRDFPGLHTLKISANMATFQNGAPPARTIDDSDVEEEALVADYQEQVQYEDGAELEQVNSLTMAQQTDDIQSRLAAAAQPLDFSAPLEVKFQSYDSYCSLFHFILNSEGPVDLEPPSVSSAPP